MRAEVLDTSRTEASTSTVEGRGGCDVDVAVRIYCGHTDRFSFPIQGVILNDAERVDPYEPNFQSPDNHDGVLESLGEFVPIYILQPA
jgi:hypothetical protein